MFYMFKNMVATYCKIMCVEKLRIFNENINRILFEWTLYVVYISTVCDLYYHLCATFQLVLYLFPRPMIHRGVNRDLYHYIVFSYENIC